MGLTTLFASSEPSRNQGRTQNGGNLKTVTAAISRPFLLSLLRRTLVSILSSAIILPVVIYLIKIGCFINHHTDQLRMVERLQPFLQGLEWRHALTHHQ